MIENNPDAEEQDRFHPGAKDGILECGGNQGNPRKQPHEFLLLRGCSSNNSDETGNAQATKGLLAHCKMSGNE